MKSHFYHLQINIDFSHVSFYKNLMTFLGWSVIYEGDDVIGFQGEGNGSLWFLKSPKEGKTDYDMIGVNHIGIQVEKQQDVNDTVAFLKKEQIAPLFETPRHRPEFAMSENETYYQVMFASPDKILFEVVYTGAK